MLDEMTSKERFINALELKEVDRVPLGYLWFGAGNAVLNRMNATMGDVYYSAKGITRAQILAREMYHHDNVMSPWGCLLVEAEALGAKINIKKDGYPSIAKFPLKSVKEYENIDPIHIERSERVKTIKESIVLLKKQLGDEVFISCAILTPFMLASQLMDVSRVFIEMMTDRDNFHALLDVLTDSCITFADVLLDAGADGAFIENGGSTSDLFSLEMAKEFGFDYSKKLYSHIQDRGGYVISHNCANHAFHELEMALEPDALNFSFGNVESLGKKYGIDCLKLHNQKHIGCNARYCFRDFKDLNDSICLMGNINPYSFHSGCVSNVAAEVKSCMAAAPEKGFILSTGCEIPLNTPPEEMEILWESMKSCFKKP
ncbi:uroporphyrinogen-III decarboxylase [Methanomethylovorans hollandica DSM 15978]|uniref:Uroporphyrinogen-III decarboxylase n=1 Tax=Methanomethylovorans hollandica (strain DSM 15978 / NBRC 107637 / DMS1) TaxID=867904 RepID=L0KV93_METHD|nr:uroporphyrinogen decarboxylase family protein [Methanomethylovorans hollandica]AGB48620.1 uroporphyrinogen-III decarboxylase [Methanomethylovorans hollandica DSM 15978]